MPSRQTGIQNVDHMVVDAGAVYADYGEPGERLIGATQGGATYRLQQNIRAPEIDGARGRIMGTRRIVNVVPQLTFSPLELNSDNWRLLIPGATGNDPMTRGVYVLDKSVHFTNIALVATKVGSADPVVIKILNALADVEELEAAFEDENEASPEITVSGHFDPTNLNGDEPWEISNPTV
jgi:hypothetical protein